MKKLRIFLIPSIIVSLFIISDVYACGDIYDLSVNDGKLSRIDKYNYKVTLEDNASEVSISANAVSNFLDGFGPRKVSTDKTAVLKTSGKDCKNDNIYTYNIVFEKIGAVAAADSVQSTDSTQSTQSTESSKLPEEFLNKAPNTAFLKDLTIDGYDLNFNKDIDNYTLTVKRDVKSLNITATPEKDDTVVKISDNAKNLSEETNIVVITLTNPDGTSGVYNIVVSKEKEKSDNNRLKSLTIEGYTINFAPAKTNYTLTINNERALAINAEVQDDKATYEVIGNSNLDTGSVITIRVTAENGDVREYKINIKREFNIMNYWIYIVIVVLILLLLIIAASSKKKRKKKKSQIKTVEGEKNTAGNASEMFNSKKDEPAKKKELPKDLNIKIIEPSYAKKGAKKTTNNDSTTPTEVFKL